MFSKVYIWGTYVFKRFVGYKRNYTAQRALLGLFRRKTGTYFDVFLLVVLKDYRIALTFDGYHQEKQARQWQKTEIFAYYAFKYASGSSSRILLRGKIAWRGKVTDLCIDEYRNDSI